MTFIKPCKRIQRSLLEPFKFRELPLLNIVDQHIQVAVSAIRISGVHKAELLPSVALFRIIQGP